MAFPPPNDGDSFSLGNTTGARASQTQQVSPYPSSTAFNTQATSPALPLSMQPDIAFLANYPPEHVAAIGRLFKLGALHLPEDARDAGSPASGTVLTTSSHTLAGDAGLEDGEVNDTAASSVSSLPHVINNSATTSKRTSTDEPSESNFQQPHGAAQLIAQSMSEFLKVMYNHGYGFPELREHIRDQEQLRQIYCAARIPTGPASDASKVSLSRSTKTNRLELSTTANPAAAPDRSEYLARLAAAKSKKPDKAPVRQNKIVKTKVAEDVHTRSANPRRVPDPKKNELLRQRLAKLRAEQAAKQQQELENFTVSGSDMDETQKLGTGLADISAAALDSDSSHFLTSSTTTATNLQHGRKRVSAAALNNAAAIEDKETPGPLDARTNSGRFVINLSEGEDSDFESDLESGTGVDISQLAEQALTKHSITDSSKHSTLPSPGSLQDSAYKKKLQEIEQAKQRLAALQMKTREKSDGTKPAVTTATTPSGVSTVPTTTPGSSDESTAIEEQHIQGQPESEDDFYANETPGIVASQVPGLTESRADVPTSADALLADVDMADDEGPVDDEDFDSVYQSVVEGENALAVGQGSAPLQTAETSEIREPYDSQADGGKSENSSDFYESEVADAKGLLTEGVGNVDDAEDSDEGESMDMSVSAESEHNNDVDDGGSDSMDMGTSSEEDEPGETEAVNYEERDIAPVIAPELNYVRDEDQPAEMAEASSGRRSYYTPYESPLTMFKNYRFNPNFVGTVRGGFRSLTFSHKIDPNITLCPTETAGGQCDRDRCDFQHFDDIKLTDHEMLNDLVSQRPELKTKEDEERWNTGLQMTIAGLQQNSDHLDINAIAKHLAQYRRDFVKDDPNME